MRDYWKYTAQVTTPGAYSSGNPYNLLVSFPWTNIDGHSILTLRGLWELFQYNGHDFSGIIGTGAGSSQYQTGVFAGSISQIQPNEAYWLKMTTPFQEHEMIAGNVLNFNLFNVNLDGRSGYRMEQPASYTMAGTGMRLVSYGEDQNQAFSAGFKWGSNGVGGSSPNAGNSPVDKVIGTAEVRTKYWTGSTYTWQGSLTLKSGHGYWMRFTRSLGESEGANFWNRANDGDDAGVTGAFVGTPDYDGGGSRTLGILYMLGSNKSPNSPSISALSNREYVGFNNSTPNFATLCINPPMTMGDEWNQPQHLHGSQDGNHNKIYDYNNVDITNSCQGQYYVMTVAKRHMHTIKKVGPDVDTTTGAAASKSGNWDNGTTNVVMGGYENITRPGQGCSLNYKIVTSGNNPVMTINAGDGTGGYNFKLGDTIRVTDPKTSGHTADFVISEMQHDPNYQFWNCGPSAHGDPNQINHADHNYHWDYQGETKTMWRLSLGFEDVTSEIDESSYPGVLTGYENQRDYNNGATDTSGIQFRMYHPLDQRFYMLRLYTNGGVAISDNNMTVANFFNNYCVKSPNNYFGDLQYNLNQGYYFKMENFTDNPGAGWNE